MSLRRQACLGASIAVVALTSPGWAADTASAKVLDRTAFDFAAGIDSCEYSEEAMYAVNYQSRPGPQLVNGPVNAVRGGTLAQTTHQGGPMRETIFGRLLLGCGLMLTGIGSAQATEFYIGEPVVQDGMQIVPNYPK
jgi:hypothetical protein